MNCLPMTDSFGFASEDFLASTADLVSVLAHLVDSSNPHSSQRRSGQRLEAAALSTLLRNIPTVVQLPPPLVPLAGPAPVPQRIGAHKAARTAEPSIPVEAMDCRSRAQRRQYCRCGQCKRAWTTSVGTGSTTKNSPIRPITAVVWSGTTLPSGGRGDCTRSPNRRQP